MRRLDRLGRDYARRTEESRFGQFQQRLIEHVQGGHRLVDDLPREEIADEAELANLASHASAPLTRADRPSGTDEH
jgi:hypothetical protein